VNANLKEKKELIKQFLLRIFLVKEIDEIFAYLSNPAKYPQIINVLERMRTKINEKKDLFSFKENTTLCDWIDDELAFSLLITQNSKCDPFKFVNF
jgi:hypothetical protein